MGKRVWVRINLEFDRGFNYTTSLYYLASQLYAYGVELWTHSRQGHVKKRATYTHHACMQCLPCLHTTTCVVAFAFENVQYVRNLREVLLHTPVVMIKLQVST
jgi:hypothetical protein